MIGDHAISKTAVLTAHTSRSLALWIGVAVVATTVAAALLSLLWTPYPPNDIAVQNRLLGPTAVHWLGTDAFGRDVFSRLLCGAQNALLVGFFAVAIGAIAGVSVGLAAASAGGRADVALMRGADFLFAFPAVLSAILIMAVTGPGVITAVLAIGIFNVPVFARLTRSVASVLWRREFVRAAQAVGKSRARITWDHVLPNLAGLLWVQASASFAIAVLAEAALSYLGLGAQPPAASWGRMLFESRTYLLQAPTLAIFPGLAVAALVLGVNLLGDALRDRLDADGGPIP